MDWADFVASCIPAPKTITVEAYTGSGPYGDVYGAAVQVEGCVVEESRRRVRVQTQDAAGEEVLSSTTVYCPPDTVAPAGSRVTTGGRTARVLAATPHDPHGQPLPAHLELNLE
jgi:hypothetical protein